MTMPRQLDEKEPEFRPLRVQAHVRMPIYPTEASSQHSASRRRFAHHFPTPRQLPQSPIDDDDEWPNESEFAHEWPDEVAELTEPSVPTDKEVKKVVEALTFPVDPSADRKKACEYKLHKLINGGKGQTHVQILQVLREDKHARGMMDELTGKYFRRRMYLTVEFGYRQCSQYVVGGIIQIILGFVIDTDPQINVDRHRAIYSSLTRHGYSHEDRLFASEQEKNNLRQCAELTKICVDQLIVEAMNQSE